VVHFRSDSGRLLDDLFWSKRLQVFSLKRHPKWSEAAVGKNFISAGWSAVPKLHVLFLKTEVHPLSTTGKLATAYETVHMSALKSCQDHDQGHVGRRLTGPYVGR
jgi:hypothetical protein